MVAEEAELAAGVAMLESLNLMRHQLLGWVDLDLGWGISVHVAAVEVEDSAAGGGAAAAAAEDEGVHLGFG